MKPTKRERFIRSDSLMRLMVAANLGTADLARACKALGRNVDVSKSTIDNWLNGKSNGQPWRASVEKIECVALVLECSEDQLCLTSEEVAAWFPIESVEFFSKSVSAAPMPHLKYQGTWDFNFEQFIEDTRFNQVASSKWTFAMRANLNQRKGSVKLQHVGQIDNREFRLQFHGQLVEAGNYIAGPYELHSEGRVEWGFVMASYAAERLVGKFLGRNNLHGFGFNSGTFEARRVG